MSEMVERVAKAIDTAPKDAPILGWLPDDDVGEKGEWHKMEWITWPDDGPQWNIVYRDMPLDIDCQPTFWLPMPPPPTREAKE